MTSMYGLNADEASHTVTSVKILRHISQQYTGALDFWRTYGGDSRTHSIPLSVSTFEMEFSAKNIHLYRVAPNENWFDKNALFNEFYNDLKGEFLAQNQNLHLVPNTFYVAENPRIVTRISQITYDSLVENMKQSALELVKIGGLQFRGDTVRQMADDEFHLIDSETGSIDRIYFRKVNQTHKPLSENPNILAFNMIAIRCLDQTFATENPNLCVAQPGISASGKYELIMESGTSQLIAVMSDIPDRDAAPIQPEAMQASGPRTCVDSGSTMHPGDYLLSANSFFKLTLNLEGYLNLVDIRYGQEIWRANGPRPENERPHTFAIQGDGMLFQFTIFNNTVERKIR